MKKFLLISSAVLFIAFAAKSQSTYTENFDTQANWAGGSMNGYNAKTYTNDVDDPADDSFSSDNAFRETSNVHSGSYAWRLKKQNGVYLRYKCFETVSAFSIYMARWDNSPTPTIEVKYSTNSGTTYTTIETIDGSTYFTGDKVYKQYSYSFASPISPDAAGDTIFIEFVTTSGERMLYDDFELEYGTGGTGPDDPSDFTATAVSTSEIDLSWTRNGDLDSVMVVKSFDPVIGSPVAGEYYAVGDTIPGGDTVIFRGTDTTYQHTGLSQNQTWNYSAFSVNSLNYSMGAFATETTLKDEPSNHVANFDFGTVTGLSIELTWNDNDGAVPADTFLLKISTSSNITAPVDGTPEADDFDLTDGNGCVNVEHGAEQYVWNGLDPGTHYYFKIWPYSNSGTNIDYKTDGTVPSADTTTPSANTNLIISEVADPGDYYQGRFVELYNVGVDTIFFDTDTWYLCRQANGSASSWADIQLTDTIPPGEAFTVAYSSTEFYNSYHIYPDMVNGGITGSGDDGYFLYYGGDHSTGTLIDAYGVIDEDGTGKDWEYTNSKAVRKRSVVSPNSTWTASEWVITSADTVNMTPGQHFNYVTWLGNTDQYWDTKANWDNGFIPDVSMDVTIPDVSAMIPPEINNTAICWDLTLQSVGQLTIKPGAELTVYGNYSGATSKDRTAADFIIEADDTGQGSMIVKGSISGNAYVRSYVTAGQWHSITSPVSGTTADSYYLGGSPDVWLKEYIEATNSYSYISDLTTPLGDMKGWMIWVGGSTAQTFSMNGTLRSGPVGSSNNMTRSQAGADYGYNFVGNPYTSAIDWDASSGWTKTNLENAIYVYNNGNWATYIGGTGSNDGSRYIAMNQGFFVQVSEGNNNGTLQMSRDVCVHNSVSFLKSAKAKQSWDDILRLQITNGTLSDETVIKLTDGATEGWDGNLDAHKLFSFNTNHPQIFSTANGKMSINSLPHETGTVAVDVTGANGDQLTITATQHSDFSHVYLTDEALGITTDLTRESYTFTYDENITDRFTISFTVTGMDNNGDNNEYFNIFAASGKIHVIQPSQNQLHVSVFNMLGQKIGTTDSNGAVQLISVPTTGYYIVNVTDGIHNGTKKVFVK